MTASSSHASKFLAAAVALCCTSTAFASPLGDDQIVFQANADLTRVHEELSNARIIPTVLDEFQPILGLSAEWSSSTVADLGNTLKPAKLQSAPAVSLVSGSSMSASLIATTYVLTLTDPDAPTRENPIWSEFCHWVATSSSPTISAGVEPAHLDPVVEYKPPGPPPKTGKHRYVFTAWVPANGTKEKLHLSKPEERKHWGGEEGRGVQKWAKENGLVAVGANFIYAQNETQ
ncbi:Carboxypeptidase Y inhibitor [Colletotrichum tanaceti]|uniref:Carboxypeptidase Y inhibitor n=1 Tax=Colletotrichum tanaceti TaxID=1306861 RepID=A0A4U6XPR4_9PEZI|nr:Carboxypeptidase Y inhibitor [Colletotrichum tanaceti]TKW57787.1 Carboxypeptidase Y inhibitor [Colletotrichum tanaceti]